MFKITLGMKKEKELQGKINALKSQIRKLEDKNKNLVEATYSNQLDFQFERKIQFMNIKDAENKLKQEMQKQLIESDLERVKAQAESTGIREQFVFMTKMIDSLRIDQMEQLKIIANLKSDLNNTRVQVVK